MSSENALLPRVWELERSLATAVRVNESLRQQLEASQKREVILRDELFAVLVQDMSRDSAIAKIEALAATEQKT